MYLPPLRSNPFIFFSKRGTVAMGCAKNNSNEDIFKELEEYVQEKKQTNKYLDDISDLDAMSSSAAAMQIRNKDRDFETMNYNMHASKKYKQKLGPPDKDLEQLNVQDYCDKMMKELG